MRNVGLLPQRSATPGAATGVTAARFRRRTSSTHEGSRSIEWLLLAAGLSAPLWTLVATVEQRGVVLGISLFALFTAGVLVLLLMRRTLSALVLLAYLAAMQPAVREYVPQVPYLSLHYVLPIYVAAALIGTRDRLRLSVPFLMYAAYTVAEGLGLLQSTSLPLARAVLLPSLATLFLLLMSAQIRLDATGVQRILNGYLAGALTVAALVGRIYLRGESVEWATHSNFSASAGMGPNQVSLIFCIAAFACLYVGGKRKGWERIGYWSMAAVLTFLMILTFSRGGLYILTGAVVLYYALSRKPTVKSTVGLVTYGLVAILTFNAAVDFSEGTALARYQQFDTSNRTALIEQGWRIFADNPLVGVGTGNYVAVVGDEDYFGLESGAHNELVRAAAEHGIYGLLTWLLFAGFLLAQATQRYRGEERATRLTFLCIALVSMAYGGLKLLIQPLLILIALSAYTARTRQTPTRARASTPAASGNPRPTSGL